MGNSQPVKLKIYSLICQRRFGPLFVTQFGGALNDNVLRNALIAMITFGVVGSDPAQRAVLVQAALGLFMLPFFLFSASAGQFADHCPDRSVAVRWIKGAEIGTMAVAAIGLALGSIGMLLLSVFMAGVQSAYFGPFKYALLPALLKREELIGGNALMNASTYVAILLGVIWGTQLGASADNDLWITALLMVVAMVGFRASMAMPPLAGSMGSWRASWSWNIFADMGRTMRGCLKVRGMVSLILLISWFWTSGAVIVAQLPLIVRDIYGYNENSYLLLLVVVCLGIALGSLLNAAVQRGSVTTKWVPLGIGLAAIMCLLIDFPDRAHVANAADLGTLAQFVGEAHSYGLGLTLAMVATAMGFYIVPMYATLQLLAPGGSRGQMVAANNIVNAFFIVAGVLVAAAVTSMVQPIATAMGILFTIIAGVGAIVAAGSFLMLRKISRIQR